MHEKLIEELEVRYRIIQEKAPDLAVADNLYKRSAAALREDAGAIAELRKKYDTTVADFESKVESLNDRLIAASYDKLLVETARETHLENERLFKECADLRAKFEKAEEALENIFQNGTSRNYCIASYNGKYRVTGIVNGSAKDFYGDTALKALAALKEGK